MRWFASTAVTSSLLLVLSTYSWAGPAEDAANSSASIHAGTLNAETPAAAAGTQNYYDNVQPTHSTGTSLTESGLKPLTQNTPLKNLKGVSQGGVTFMQSSDKPLLRVTMVPNFATGDIATVAIEQDLSASGVIDYTTSFGGGGLMISGICSNGAILCSPGTSSNCIYERWDATSTGGLTSSSRLGTPTTEGDLFSCYCFNNHCSRFNNAGVLNLAQISQELAGTLLAKLMDARSDFIISSVSSSSSSVIAYYGTKASTISTVDGYTAPQKANKDYSKLPALTANTPDVSFGYYTNSGALDAAATAENQAMSENPNSLYNLVYGLQDQGSEIRNCTNIRTFGAATQTVTSNNTATNTVCTDDTLHFRMRTDDKKTFTVDFGGTGPGGNLNVANPVMGHNCPGWSAPFSVGSLSPPAIAGLLDAATTFASYSCQYGGTLIGSQWISTSPASLPWVTGSGRYGASGAQWPAVTCSTYGEYTVETLLENTTNGCASLENDAKCRPKEEKWDGRPYRTNFLLTGFTMAQTRYDLPGTLRNYTVYRPWIKQERTYVCDKGKGEDFTSFLTGLRGQVKATQDSAVLPEGAGGTATCEISCKVKVARSETTVRRGDVDSDVKQEDAVTQAAYDYYVKVCTVRSGANVCPVDLSKGEVIDKDCSCIDEFGEALARTDAINKAANDSICSSVRQE